jgi:predicted  nucleic acid-binding Zn-ribbon protein
MRWFELGLLISVSMMAGQAVQFALHWRSTSVLKRSLATAGKRIEDLEKQVRSADIRVEQYKKSRDEYKVHLEAEKGNLYEQIKTRVDAEAFKWTNRWKKLSETFAEVDSEINPKEDPDDRY